METKQKVLRFMRNDIMKAGEGKVYILSDFTVYGDYETVKKSMQRLCTEGIIRRILNGIYERPKYSHILKRYVMASPDDVAKAIARGKCWTIIPAGEKALNMLGLSTQIPAKVIYMTDGPNRKYTYLNQEIQFKHVQLRNIAGLSTKTALVVEALKNLGEKNVTDAVVQKLSVNFTKDEKEKLLRETKHTTLWIRDVIVRIVRSGGNSCA